MSWHQEQWTAASTTVKTFVQTHPAVWYASGLVLAFFAGVIVG